MGKLIYKIAEVLRDGTKYSGIIISISIGFGVDSSNFLYDMLTHKELSQGFFSCLFFSILAHRVLTVKSFGKI